MHLHYCEIHEGALYCYNMEGDEMHTKETWRKFYEQ